MIKRLRNWLKVRFSSKYAHVRMHQQLYKYALSQGLGVVSQKGHYLQPAALGRLVGRSVKHKYDLENQW